ncbi:hypothetical protein [Brevundimonas sp. CEF1]|uniref:hypothetical protein n=1 Tax=Brevundimonas sp. CEF1 TaxID=3442642 RepID=UPI003F50E5D9
MVILSDESAYGKRRLIGEARAPVDRARRKLEASPSNPRFVSDYRQALQAFIEDHREAADPGLIKRYEQDLRDLGTGSAAVRGTGD